MMRTTEAKPGHPWLVRYERMLVIFGSILLGMPVWFYFAWKGQFEWALALHLPFYLVHFHWRGKFRGYLVTCLFAWGGLGLYTILRHYGIADAISIVLGLLVGSMGAGFRSSHYLAEAADQEAR